jgi:serine/threonine-protein kinase
VPDRKRTANDDAGDGAPPSSKPSPSVRGERRTLGKYRFVASLGHGGMAEVFLAVAIGPAGFNKLQVIKRLRPVLAEDADLRAMFLDEARLAARLNHRNVVQTNEVDLVDGQYFMAMEYLDGQPLSRVLQRLKEVGKIMPVPVILRVLEEVLHGLQYAHDLADYDGTPLGVVHRDISPQNVFLTYDGQVKIVDFGIAKAARRVVETQTGVIKGKVSYMAPEQAFSSSDAIDRRADLFSVGVILWETLAERRLWQGMGDPEIIAALLSDVPRIAEVRPDAPPELARVCDRALELSADDRYPSAAAFRADLELAGRAAKAEDLGALLDGLFREQRAHIKKLLARQVDLVQRDGDSELLDLDRGSLPRGMRSRTPSSIPPPPSRSFDHAATSETPPPSTLSSPRVTRPTPPPGRGEEALFTAHGPPPSRAPLLLGGVIAAGAAAGVYLLLAGREAAHTAASTASASVSSVAQGASAAPIASPLPITSTLPAGAYVHVHLAASPAEARILVDGAALPSNPFDGRFIKDGAVHRIQIEAAGFLPQSRLLVFDKDLSFEAALQPKPKADAPGMKPDPYK